MNLNFIINKYLLIWNILYQNSVLEEEQVLKQKLWKNNKKEYSLLYKEKDLILKELNDYIPDDDDLYNLVETSDCYKKIRQETNKYRLNLLEMWTMCNRKYQKSLNKILKYDLTGNFDICVIHPGFDLIEIDFDSHIMQLGKKLNMREKESFMTFLFYKILENEFGKIKKYEQDIYNVILELVCLNELYSKVTGESKYNIGNKRLRVLKNKIYPYWLMYLGISSEDMEKYMVRDNLFFDINDYKYETKLKNIDIFSFANFIINNKQEILNKKAIGIEKIGIETL